MITNEGMIEFALVEYRRDAEFRLYVDGVVQALIARGEVRPGSSLAAILGHASLSSESLAKDLLQRFHNRSTLPQWQRARLPA